MVHSVMEKTFHPQTFLEDNVSVWLMPSIINQPLCGLTMSPHQRWTWNWEQTWKWIAWELQITIGYYFVFNITIRKQLLPWVTGFSLWMMWRDCLVSNSLWTSTMNLNPLCCHFYRGANILPGTKDWGLLEEFNGKRRSGWWWDEANEPEVVIVQRTCTPFLRKANLKQGRHLPAELLWNYRLWRTWNDGWSTQPGPSGEESVWLWNQKTSTSCLNETEEEFDAVSKNTWKSKSKKQVNDRGRKERRKQALKLFVVPHALDCSLCIGTWSCWTILFQHWRFSLENYKST